MKWFSVCFVSAYCLLLSCSFCSAYSGFDVSFTSKFTVDQSTCTGGNNKVNEGVVELFVRKGRSCEDSGGWFYEVVCGNSSDLLKAIPPGGWADVRCAVDSSPFEDDAPNCVMVKWCGQEAYYDYDKTRLGVLSTGAGPAEKDPDEDSALCVAKGYTWVFPGELPVGGYSTVMYKGCCGDDADEYAICNSPRECRCCNDKTDTLAAIARDGCVSTGGSCEKGILELTAPGSPRGKAVRIYLGQTVSFYISRSCPPITGYTLSYGEGQGSAFSSEVFTPGQKITSKRYDYPGIFTAEITFSTDKGEGKDRVTVEIADLSAVLKSGTEKSSLKENAELKIRAGDTIYLDASGSKGSGGPIFSWDYGDGEKVPGGGQSITEHKYALSGLYTLHLEVSNDLGDRLVREIALEVDPALEAVIGAKEAGDSTLKTGAIIIRPASTVLFSAKGSYTGGRSVGYTWDYGDGSPPAEENAGESSHAYVEPGLYLARLTVADDKYSGNDEISVVVSSEDVDPSAALCEGYSETKKLPSKLDWRYVDGKNYLSSVKSQGSCGSCWVFASVGGIEAYNLRKTVSPQQLDLSEQEVISCSSGEGCGGGTPDEALGYARDRGVCYERCLGYGESEYSEKKSAGKKTILPCGLPDCCKNEKYKLDIPFTETAKNNEQMKELMICKGPVLNTANTDHQFITVGYDDDSEICKLHYGTGGCWIVKNSWGTFTGYPANTGFWGRIWHVDGYAYMPYTNTLSSFYFFD